MKATTKDSTVTVRMTERQRQKWEEFCGVHSKNGRPSKYRPEYCQQLIEFFDVKPYRTEVVITHDYWRNEWKEEKRIPNPVPYLIDFSEKIGVSVPALHRWGRKSPAFRSAYAHARAMREAMLCKNGLLGLYDLRSWIFVMKNLAGWTDSQHTARYEQIFNVILQDSPKPD